MGKVEFRVAYLTGMDTRDKRSKLLHASQGVGGHPGTPHPNSSFFYATPVAV